MVSALAGVIAALVAVLTFAQGLTGGNDRPRSATIPTAPHVPPSSSRQEQSPSPTRPPSASPRSAAPSSPAADPLVGRFSGNIVHSGGPVPTYPVELLLRDGDVGENVGETSYELQHCRGTLILMKRRGGELHVQENIVQEAIVTDERLRCAGQPLYFAVGQSAGGGVKMRYFRAGQDFAGTPYASGTLRRLR